MTAVVNLDQHRRAHLVKVGWHVYHDERWRRVVDVQKVRLNVALFVAHEVDPILIPLDRYLPTATPAEWFTQVNREIETLHHSARRRTSAR